MSEEPPQSNNHSHQKSWINRIAQLLTGEPQDQDDLLEILKEAREKHLLGPDAFAMIEGVMQVSQMRARDIMVPRVQMVVVPKDAELKTILPLVLEHGHSRFPVIEDDRSTVVGIMLAKDLLPHAITDLDVKVEELMRPVSIVPESKRLNVLLKEFRTNRNHMAIVVDEYGAAAGLVTIEDVLEQIVGEIEDEHDQTEEDYIIQRGENEYTVKALTPIEDLDDFFSSNFASDEYDTVGGLIVTRLGHLPKKGEKVVDGKFRFEVIRADNRRIYLLKLKVIDSEA
ncbi:MAG: HlyC/CorC family transporter [Gammaproteobacteria bacterium]